MQQKRGFDLKSHSTLLALIALAIILGVATKGDFLLSRNFTNLTLQVAINALLAVGMTFVILTGGIDLSVGSVVALSGVVAGIAQVHWGWGTASACMLALGAGLACGLVNGPLIAYMRIPPFVITLGMMVIAGGTALILSDSSAISPMADNFKGIAKGHLEPWSTGALFGALFLLWAYSLWKRVRRGQHTTGALMGDALLEFLCLGIPAAAYLSDRGVPYPVLILGAVAVAASFVLARIPIGRFVYAIGGNEEAAALSGIAELDAIAAVVIGGTSLSGGQGSVRGSIIGAFFIGTVNNGMDLLGIDSNYQMVIKGLIIIVAVGADAHSRRKGR